jgi:hypothetical protein
MFVQNYTWRVCQEPYLEVSRDLYSVRNNTGTFIRNHTWPRLSGTKPRGLSRTLTWCLPGTIPGGLSGNIFECLSGNVPRGLSRPLTGALPGVIFGGLSRTILKICQEPYLEAFQYLNFEVCQEPYLEVCQQ